MLAYAADVGPVPCDIYVYPDVAAVQFEAPILTGFQSALHGTEFLVLELSKPVASNQLFLMSGRRKLISTFFP